MRFPLLLKPVLCVLLLGWGLEAARPLCSAKNCASISKRETLGPRHLISRGLAGIEKRVEPVADDEQSITDYVVKKVHALSSKEKIYDDESDKTVSTSVWRPFADSKNNWAPSFPLGLTKLTGCTSLVIVSNHGVYAAHFYEDVSMEPKDKTYARKLLESGSGKAFKALKSYFDTLNSSPHGPDYPFPQVYVIAPVKMTEEPEDPSSKQKTDRRPGVEIGYDAGKALQYPGVTQDIITTVESLWPQINTITTVPYYPLNLANKRTKDMKDPSVLPDLKRIINGTPGKILFEYENANNAISIRLWIEATNVLELTL